MNRRTPRSRLTTKSANRIGRGLEYFHPRLEPLEHRTMLSAVNWTIDQAASNATLNIPSQTLSSGPLNGLALNFANQDSSGNLTGTSWTTNDNIELSGTIATNYIDGLSIQFVNSPGSIQAVAANTVFPSPANFVPVSGSSPDGNFTGTNGGSAVQDYGGFIVAPGLGSTYENVGPFSVSNVTLDLASSGANPLPITGTTFATSDTLTGIENGTLALDIESQLVQELAGNYTGVLTSLTTSGPTIANTASSAGAITNLGGGNRQLTLPVTMPLAFSTDIGVINAMITGTIVAMATIATDGPVITGGASSTWANAGPVAMAGGNTVTASRNLASLTVAISSPKTGDVLHATGLGNISVAGNGTSTLVLSGSDTAGDYQSVLQSVTYNNTNNGPGIASVTIGISGVDANGAPSNGVVDTVNITNAPPVLLLNAPSASYTSAWTGAPTPIASSTATITDGESGNLVSMTVSIPSPQPGDGLGDGTANGGVVAGTSITSSLSSGAGGLVLTLSGTDTLAHYQQVLRSITYNNPVGGQGVTSETVSVVANDGAHSSVAALARININPPVVVLNPSSSTWTDGGLILIGNFSTVTDDGSDTLESLTATLTTAGSPHAGDVLGDLGTPNGGIVPGTDITSSYNAGTGVLTLSGNDTLDDYQQALQSITYNNTAGSPGVSAETISVVANDGTNSSTAVTETINISVRPVVVLSPSSSAWTNGGPVTIGNLSTVTDGASTNLVSLTASLTSPHIGDVLSDSVAGTSITSSYNAGTSVLTLSGTDTLAHYQQVLRTIKYNNTAGGPDVPSETLSVVANDGMNSSTAVTDTINISAGPVVVLTPSGSTWTMNSGPVTIGNLSTITDGESGTLFSLTVWFPNPEPGDVLDDGTPDSGIVPGTNIMSSDDGSGGLILMGPDTLAHFQQVLRSITYDNTFGGPGLSPEMFEVDASDGTHDTDVVGTISINPPVVVLTPSSSTWTNGGPVTIGHLSTLTDFGSGSLGSLTASITSPHAGDVLGDGTANGGVVAGTSITSSYNTGTGVLTLSGIDTLAHYQQVLRSITYNNTAGGPGIGAETVSVVASDSTNSSTAVVGTINISVRPLVVLLPSSSIWTNGGPVTIGNLSTVTDAETGNLVSLTASITSLHTGDLLSDSVTGTNITSSYNVGTGVLTLSGSDTLAHYQQVLRSITYNNTAGGPGVRGVTVSVVANDGTNSSTAVANTINISVPPVVAISPSSSTWTNGGPVTFGNLSTVTDGESASLVSLSASITNLHTGDVLSDSVTGTSITSSYNVGTGALTLSGTDTLAHYQQVLRSITYNNTAGGPGVGAATVSVVANDGANTNAAAVATININVAPVVLLNSPTANNATTFTNAGPVTIGNSGHVSVTDGEASNLVSLTASITTLHTGDVLTDSTAGTSVTSTYNAGTGVLTLSGSDTLAHYQQILATIAYNNTSGSPGVASETVSVVANDGANSSTAAVATINIMLPSTVSGVNLFYDNSKFNKNVEGVGNGTTDDKAIDITKTAYLPGAGTANFSNISSFTDGINGIMVDMTQGAGVHGSINASDFTFRVGLNNSPSKWATAPNPSTISVRTGSPAAGKDRVELTWTDGSITQEFLEVTVHADLNTGLSAPYTFFYGSVIANTGTGDTGALAITSSTDENAARSHSGTATVTNMFDFNKDGFVNSSDENAARGSGATIKFIKIAANTPLVPDAAPSVAPDVSVGPTVTSDVAMAPAAAPARIGSDGDTGLASGLASLLGSLKTGTLPAVRLDLLSSELTNVNLNSGAAATIFEALAVADTKLTRSILVEADKFADELGLDDSLLESILVDLGLA